MDKGKAKDIKKAKTEDAKDNCLEQEDMAELKKEDLATQDNDEALDPLAEALAKYAELEDKYLRLAAEYDNFRRRTKKEKEALYADSITDVVCRFLAVADNIDRALEQVTEEMTAEMESFYEGVDLIRKQFDEVLLSFDIEEIAALGETFDPNFHNAVSIIEDEKYGEKEITEVFERGYKRADRVLRYSIVQVAN